MEERVEGCGEMEKGIEESLKNIPLTVLRSCDGHVVQNTTSLPPRWKAGCGEFASAIPVASNGRFVVKVGRRLPRIVLVGVAVVGETMVRGDRRDELDR